MQQAEASKQVLSEPRIRSFLLAGAAVILAGLFALGWWIGSSGAKNGEAPTVTLTSSGAPEDLKVAGGDFRPKSEVPSLYIPPPEPSVISDTDVYAGGTGYVDPPIYSPAPVAPSPTPPKETVTIGPGHD